MAPAVPQDTPGLSPSADHRLERVVVAWVKQVVTTCQTSSSPAYLHTPLAPPHFASSHHTQLERSRRREALAEIDPLDSTCPIVSNPPKTPLRRKQVTTRRDQDTEGLKHVAGHATGDSGEETPIAD